ncbi:DMT family transporter [Alteromonas halophila]|nr:DMT family transporter [Alteromonas halophila]
MTNHRPNGLTLFLLASLAMMAFAGNSLLCRMALTQTTVSPGVFTEVRLVSGAVTLLLLALLRRQPALKSGSWTGALALFIYAAGFSYAYVGLSTGTGALLLFGAVQLTMMTAGIMNKESFAPPQLLGIVLAILGLVILLLPGVSAPEPGPALLMIVAGIAWGVYSLLGQRAFSGLAVTTGNFLRTLPMVILLGLVLVAVDEPGWDREGVLLAIASGTLASALGYAIWYLVLPSLTASIAATLQLSVPVIAAIAGWAFLSEPISVRMLVASITVLGGIALVIHFRRR